MSIHSGVGWRDFWKADCLASCVPDNPATAEQIAKTWRAWFAEFSDGSRILDVATGNGIVLAHAAASARSNGRSFVLTGVDLAAIDPKKYVSNLDQDLRSASFLGGVPAEKLPFAADSFDVVASQYGLEYADLDRALSEAARVLTAGGQLLWLAHSENSEIVRQHRQQVDDVDYLLSPRGPVYVMNKFVERQRKRKDFTYSRDMLTASFSEAEDYCRDHPPAEIVRELCGEFSNLLNRGFADRPADLAKKLTLARQRLISHRDRIRSLVAAVMTPDRIESIKTALEEPAWTGLSMDEIRVGTNESPIGLGIRAQRAKS